MLADKIIRVGSSSRRVFLTAMAVVVTFGLYRWILSPFGNQLLAAQRYNSTLDGTIRRARVLGTTLESKRAKLKELSSESVKQQNKLFTPDEAREFFASLPAAARKAGCFVASVSQAPEQRVAPQDRKPDSSGIVGRKAVVTVIGGYSNTAKFLEDVQTRRRRIWIDSVRMDAGAAGKLKCQVSLTLYCVERMETASYE